MDRDNPKVFLNEAYCFTDDTFKRRLGFVTLLIFVYVGPLQKMVKLCAMESETGGLENWTIFWRFFNDVIRLSQKDGALIKQ